MASYAKNKTIRLTATFTLSGGAADPNTLTFKVKDPTGTETTHVYPGDAAVIKDQVGAYHLDVLANISGKWYYRAEGAGSGAQNVDAADEQSFYVLTSEF